MNKTHIEPMELVGTFEVAEMAGVTVQAVSNWTVRRRDFPPALAQLASGPVWKRATVRKWLVENGMILNESTTRGDMDTFVQGQEYTLDQIRASLGGETMSYLPQRGGRIVCGRFTIEMNNEAPERVLVGYPPKVQRKAKLLAQQRGVLPIFMKTGPGRWRFHGLMEFVEYVTDMAIVEPKAGAAGRSGEVVGMLVFRTAEEASK